MTHDEAVLTLAVEGYVVGDMTPAEEAVFEAHYVNCPACHAAMEEWLFYAEFLKKRKEVQPVGKGGKRLSEN